MRIQKQELLDAIDELQHGKHTLQTCEKLAAVYTVLGNMYPEDDQEQTQNVSYGYSGTHTPQRADNSQVGIYGESEFLKAIAGKDSREMWMLMDEAMTVLAMSNKRLYDHIMSRI